MAHLISVEPRGRILRVLLTDWMDEAAYEHIAPYIDTALDEFDSARILFDLTEYAGREPGADFESMELSLPNWSKVERVAVLGHARFEDRLAAARDAFPSARVQFFPLSEKSAADEWIHEEIA